MPLPEPDKKYLIVFCKACDKGFRVWDEPLEAGKRYRVPEPQELKCRGCGHVATYERLDMRTARVGPKPASNHK